MTPQVGMPVTVVDARGVKGPGVVLYVKNHGCRVRADFRHECEEQDAWGSGKSWFFGFDGTSAVGLTLIFEPFNPEGGGGVLASLKELIPAVEAYLQSGDPLAKSAKRRVWTPVLARAREAVRAAEGEA